MGLIRSRLGSAERSGKLEILVLGQRGAVQRNNRAVRNALRIPCIGQRRDGDSRTLDALGGDGERLHANKNRIAGLTADRDPVIPRVRGACRGGHLGVAAACPLLFIGDLRRAQRTGRRGKLGTLRRVSIGPAGHGNGKRLLRPLHHLHSHHNIIILIIYGVCYRKGHGGGIARFQLFRFECQGPTIVRPCDRAGGKQGLRPGNAVLLRGGQLFDRIPRALRQVRQGQAVVVLGRVRNGDCHGCRAGIYRFLDSKGLCGVGDLVVSAGLVHNTDIPGARLCIICDLIGILGGRNRRLAVIHLKIRGDLLSVVVCVCTVDFDLGGDRFAGNGHGHVLFGRR